MGREIMIRRPFTLRAGLAIGALLALVLPATAQNFPDRTVKVIVPFPAGGTADAMPRVVAEFLTRKWGHPVIIENRAGAGGNVGAEAAFRADPDGYTLFSAPPPPLVYNHILNPKLNFDPTQFIPIAVMGKVPNSILTNSPKLKDVKTVADFVKYAKANPGALNSATQGVGTTAHLTSELFQMMAGVKFQHIHYRGSGPAVQDLVAGNVDVAFDNIGAAMALIKGDKLRILGVSSDKRVPALPNVPTVAETVPGFVVVTWFAFAAPPKTPQAIVAKINADVNEALRDPTVRSRLANMNAEVVGGSLEDNAKFFKSESAMWAKVIKDANVKITP
jgi:tripartite-type tricarboxylate transporter receptor subunit TctC